MTRILSILTVLGLVFSVSAGASELIIFPAPSLVGLVTPEDVVSGTTELPGGIDAVLSVRLLLTGMATGGTIECDGVPYPAEVMVIAFASNSCISQFGWFDAESPELVGEVTIGLPFVWHPFHDDPAPWSCWIDEPLYVEIDWALGYPAPCHFVELPSFDITWALFVVEIEGGTPVESGSWGAVKALYR